MRLERMLPGSLSRLTPPRVALPATPPEVVPDVVAPAAPVDGVRSSTGAPSSLGGVLWHATTVSASSAVNISLFIGSPWFTSKCDRRLISPTDPTPARARPSRRRLIAASHAHRWRPRPIYHAP